MLPILLVCVFAIGMAIPNSMVEQIKSNEVKNNKVKRAESENPSTEDNPNSMNYFMKPTAIKRGTNLQPQGPLQPLTDWNIDRPIFRDNQYSIDNFQSGLFSPPDVSLDDKTLQDYEKGFRYGTSRDKLDEALENAVLKGELYGNPINQYRYYGPEDRRKKRDTKKLRLKRNIDLTPEEVLALLTLYENNRQSSATENYRQPWTRYGNNFLMDDQPDLDVDVNDDTWLDRPVYPHASLNNDLGSDLFDYENGYDKGRWNNVRDNRNKRFIVAKKRTNDPTRMLRYLNGPNENDFSTLSKVLNNQKDSSKPVEFYAKPNVPVYRRLIL